MVDFRNGRQSTNVEDRRRQGMGFGEQRKTQQDTRREPEQKRQEPPPWIENAWGAYHRGRQNHTYETGDRDVDAFLRDAMQGDHSRAPNPEIYQNPDAFRRTLENYYEAGQYADQGALESLNAYGDSPIRRLMRRAYDDGLRARRQPQQFMGPGLGFGGQGNGGLRLQQ